MLINKELGDGFWGFYCSGARVGTGIERDWLGSAGRDSGVREECLEIWNPRVGPRWDGLRVF